MAHAARLAPDATLPGPLYPWSSSSRASAASASLPHAATASGTAAAVHSRLATAAAARDEVRKLLDQMQQFMEVHLAVPEHHIPQDHDDGAISDADSVLSSDDDHDDVQQTAHRAQVIRATVPGVHVGNSFVSAMMAGPAQTASAAAAASRHQAGSVIPVSATISSQQGPQQLSGLQLLLWIKDHTPGARRLLGGDGSSPGVYQHCMLLDILALEHSLVL